MSRRRGPRKVRSSNSIEELMAAMELIGQIRNALDMQLGGANILKIARQLDVSEPRARELLEMGQQHQTYLRNVEFDLGQLRRLQMERYDHLLSANWQMAMGDEVRNTVQEMVEHILGPEPDPLIVANINFALGERIKARMYAGKLVLDIMAAQNKLLGINEERDTAAVVMPTVVIMSPRPERGLHARQQEAIDVRAELRAQMGEVDGHAST